MGFITPLARHYTQAFPDVGGELVKIKVMATNEYIIKATLIAYKQGNISLDDAVELIADELDLATVK